MSRYTILAAFLAVLALAGCRGMESSEPPIHPNLNMDFQERFDPQTANPFFADNMAMRAPVPGTVARGMLREDTRFYEGRTEGGALVERLPVPVTRELLERGQERYDIHCTVCHGRAGDGEGIIMTGNYGYTQAPSYHIDRLREVSDGYLYDVVTNGIRTMPGYAHQVSVADRWAIVAYMRALQRSQHATEDELPSSALARIEQERSANIEGGRAGVSGAGEGEAAALPEEEAEEAPAEETEEEAPAAAAPDTAEGEEAAAAETEEAGATPEEDTADAPAEEAPVAEETQEDTTAAQEDTAATAQEDTTAAEQEDTTGTVAAETEAGAPAEEAEVQTGERTTGGVISSTALILILVVLPVLALLALLVIAFRKKREH